MSTIKGPAVRGNGREGIFSTAWRAVNNLTLKPQVYRELVQLYGPGLRYADIVQMASEEISIKGRSLEVIEQGHYHQTLKVATEISTGGAGADIAIVNSNGSGRIGFLIHVPGKYGTELNTAGNLVLTYRIVSKVANGSNFDYVAESVTGAAQITTAVPVGADLINGASMFAPGSGQPAGSVQDYFSHFHEVQILKDTINIEGGQQALEEWEAMLQDPDGSSLGLREMARLRLKMQYQFDDKILNSRANDAALTQANRFGESNLIPSDNGLLPSMYVDGMKQFYTGTYNMDQFDQIKFLYASQGVMSGSGMYCMGQELNLSIENAQLPFIKEYSGGTDLYTNMKTVGFNVREIFKNGFKSYLIPIPEFSNPTTYAADGFNFETLGMMFPDSKVTATMNSYNQGGMSVDGYKKSVSHVSLGYLNYNGEDRRLIVANKAGVNGKGIPVSDDWDDNSVYMLSEMMSIFLALNQTILVLRTDQ